jgi:hypothetical protein
MVLDQLNRDYAFHGHWAFKFHDLSEHREFWLDSDASRMKWAVPVLGESMVEFQCLLSNIICGIQGRLIVEGRMFLSQTRYQSFTILALFSCAFPCFKPSPCIMPRT